MKKIIIQSSLIFFLINIYSCRCRDAELMKKGNNLIIQIDDYKKRTDSLPISLKDLGMKETEKGPLYYRRKDSSTYLIWFGTSLGESKTYYSDKKKWEDYQR